MDVEVKKLYRVKISNMFSGFKNVDGGGDDVDINRACRSVTI
jgi:hypothetical protein